MIRRVAQQRFEDGQDGLSLHHMLEKGEMYDCGTLMARIQLQPGAGIDYHRHDGELEIYIVTKGCLTVKDDEVEGALGPGDVLLTPDGHSHSIHNRSEAEGEFLAIILKGN